MYKQQFDKAAAEFSTAMEYPLNLEAAKHYSNDRST